MADQDEARKHNLRLYKPDHNINNPEFYQPSEDLKTVVNMAIDMGNPLLITGDPGSGKTQLAYWVAHEQSKNEGQTPTQPLVFVTKSTSVEKDLLYRYDSLRHFQYVQNRKETSLVEAITAIELFSEKESAFIEENFIHYEPFGKAIINSRKPNGNAPDNRKRQVILVDEIDKAPRDLPNDILNLLDNMEFEVPEINRVGERKYIADESYRPVVILTSNSEQHLPDAFLRRCIYYHMEMPSPDDLAGIIMKKSGIDQASTRNLIEHFMLVRDLADWKKPSTGELILWSNYLVRRGLIEKIPKTLGELKDLNEEDYRNIWSSYGLLVKHKKDLRVLNSEIGNEGA